ncbi:hypothetical protein [Nocardia africana]
MSNYWDLLCRDCGDTYEFEWNRGGDHIQELIPYMGALAKMAPAYEILDRHPVRDYHMSYDLLTFAAEHQDHDLIAIDEYGTLYGDCYHRYACPCCGSQLKCGLPKGHDGDHGPKPKAP